MDPTSPGPYKLDQVNLAPSSQWAVSLGVGLPEHNDQPFSLAVRELPVQQQQKTHANTKNAEQTLGLSIEGYRPLAKRGTP